MIHLKQYEAYSYKKYTQLEKDNRYTLPKIPVEYIFSHPDAGAIYDIRRNADKLIDTDEFPTLPYETIETSNIVPTQKNLRIDNLKSTEDIGKDTDAYLVEYLGLYYVLDGHHRIASNILNGETNINAYVYHQEKIKDHNSK